MAAPLQCFILKAVLTLNAYSQECWSFYTGFQYLLQKIGVQVIEALIHVYLNSNFFFFFTKGLRMAEKHSSAFLHSITLTALTNFIPSSKETSLRYSTEALEIHFYKTRDTDALDNLIQCPNHVCFKFIRFESENQL